jgi:transmembrane sensor
VDINEFSDLVEKYKRGKCSSREMELIEKFLESFQSNSGGWIESEMGNKSITEEKILSGIKQNINKEKNHYIARTFFSPSLLKRAASIIFFLILGSGILYISGIFRHKTNSVVWYEESTLAGEKTIITLSDGSQVTLNADSKLRYPGQFKAANRKVYLIGEGYFIVHHNNNQPFIVYTENLTTTVLGTKFNISAYPENKTIAVSLLDGKVKVARSDKGKIDNVIFLKPKEKLLYDKDNDVSKLGLFDSIEAVGWKDNIYKFENEPLSIVFPQLERAFGVKFKITGQTVLSQKITIKFEKKYIKTVIDVLKNLTGLDYKIVMEKNDIKEVLFYRNIR